MRGFSNGIHIVYYLFGVHSIYFINNYNVLNVTPSYTLCIYIDYRSVVLISKFNLYPYTIRGKL